MTEPNAAAGDRAGALPSSGRVAGKVHIYPLRVYYEDTDIAGIVYYANYLKFAERARTEMLRLAGFEQTALFESHGISFAVRNCEADYRRPARMDDVLEVHSRMINVGRASLRTEQTVHRGDEMLVRLRLRVACIDLEGRPARMPDPIFAMLSSFITRQD